MSAFLVTYGTRLDVIEADDETDARIAWIERHRPDWWDPKRMRHGGPVFDPYRDIVCRVATATDLERIDEIVTDTRQYLGKTGTGWR